MQISGVTREEIEKALKEANLDYGGNLRIDELEALNKKGTRHKLRLKVVSSRRPGSRVSPERYYFGGDVEKPRRIAAACWHANRDFYRAIFGINPEARIRTALACYDGEEDFEDKFVETGFTNIGSMIAPAQLHACCNCNSGDYPEFATEGLTAEQYELRRPIWDDYPEFGYVKAPKYSEAVIHDYAGGPVS